MTEIIVTPGPKQEVVVHPHVQPVATIGNGINPLETQVLPVSENIPIGYAVANINGQAARFDPTNLAHAYAFAGIATTSAIFGQFVVVQPSGVVFIPGWNLTPGAVYSVGASGQISTIPDLSTGRILLTLGQATSTNTLLLRPDDPISL